MNCGTRTYKLSGGGSYLQRTSARDFTVFTDKQSDVGFYSDVIMRVELIDWSVGGNITLTVPIPIEI